MVIDFHTHVFPDEIAGKTLDKLRKMGGIRPYADGTLNGLKASMKEAGVDISIILPVVTKPSQFRTVNDFAAKINDENRELISLGGIHPDCRDYKAELGYINSLGIKGIKLHPDYQETYVDDIKMIRIIDYAAELGMVIVLHAGVDVAFPDVVRCTPGRVENLLKQTSPEKLVLAHMGGIKYWDQVEECLIGQNVYLDTGFALGEMQDEQFVRITRSHGADKVLFATDSPWKEQKQMVAYIKALGLEKEELGLILFRNAQRLLGL